MKLRIDLPYLAEPRPVVQKSALVTRKRAKGRKERQQSAHVKAVRLAVFDREQATCRCCGIRIAESMHEIVPRSLGGKVSLQNSIAVCGSGTTKCHGLIQSHRILVIGRDAEQTLTFSPATQQARDWMAGK